MGYLFAGITFAGNKGFWADKVVLLGWPYSVEEVVACSLPTDSFLVRHGAHHCLFPSESVYLCEEGIVRTITLQLGYPCDLTILVNTSPFLVSPQEWSVKSQL